MNVATVGDCVITGMILRRQNYHPVIPIKNIGMTPLLNKEGSFWR
jgi:hypothetical protein